MSGYLNFLIISMEYIFNCIFMGKMPKMDSREISIEQINKLDATAFRMLYKTYYKALVCYAIQITGESGAAEDIVQELFSTLLGKSNYHLSHWCHLRPIYIIPFECFN